MRIDRPINWLLTLLFGKMPDGDRKVWFHSQNLNEDRHGEPRWLPYHGRCWLHFGMKREFQFSWNLWTHFCGFSIGFDPTEDGWTFHAAFPPVSFWFSTNIFSARMRQFLKSEKMDKWNQKYGGHPGSSKYTGLELINVSVHDWALWWTCLKFDWGWSAKMPKWMESCFHFDDFLLGKVKYTNESVGPARDVMVPMPEGEYPTKMQLERSTWKRPRSPFKKTSTGFKIDIPRGIPHQGKGTESYNCGEDALMGCWSEGDSVRSAIETVQKKVLESRRRYDGNMMAKYPDPALRPPPEPIPPAENTTSAS